jgi:Glyoxalase-like domain
MKGLPGGSPSVRPSLGVERSSGSVSVGRRHDVAVREGAEPKTARNRGHLDLAAPHVQAEVARLIELGATRVADMNEWVTYGRSCKTRKATNTAWPIFDKP